MSSVKRHWFSHDGAGSLADDAQAEHRLFSDLHQVLGVVRLAAASAVDGNGRLPARGACVSELQQWYTCMHIDVNQTIAC